MSPGEVEKVCRKVDGQVPVEVSGRITLDSVGAYAQTGVDFISLGALTHSAPALDIGLDLD
jgi:nicotinate-nucleotide pyrophosphorylase (carboxylating)